MLTLDNVFYIKDALERIFPDWQITDDLEIMQKQSDVHVRIITEQQMVQVRSLGLFPAAMTVDPKTIWVKFVVVSNGGHCGGGGIL